MEYYDTDREFVQVFDNANDIENTENISTEQLKAELVQRAYACIEVDNAINYSD